MHITTELLLSLYGALLSTTLAVLSIAKFLRERPRISVDAELINTTALEGDDTHGVLVQVRRGHDVLWEEADVEIRVRNAGDKACQITDVFVETATTIRQVRPEGLPVFLDPNSSCSVRVQPEYFAPKKSTDAGKLEGISVEAVGVFDGLGKKHRISRDTLEKLVRRCQELPLRTALYRHKETGHVIAAFQIKDAGTIVKKKDNSA
jgi:hypothetical protein